MLCTRRPVALQLNRCAVVGFNTSHYRLQSFFVHPLVRAN
jgi:hypothetical protein